VLKTGDEQQAFQMWNDAFNGGQDGAKPLPSQWIKHLMDVSKTGMSTPQSKPAVKKPAAQPVQQPALSEMRLFNALMLNENFADGRNPQDKGDSKRHGVPTKSSVSNLRKVAKQGGRKGQLAHWMANMKAGKAKKNEEFNSEYDDEAGMAQSNLRTMARAVDGLLKTIKSNDNLPEWGQEKIAKAEMMLVSVWDYLLSQKEMGMDPKISESVAVNNLRQIVSELSNEKLAQYKTAAGASASAADKAGNYAKGNKRFSGIVKATKKQFANDEKKVGEDNSSAMAQVAGRLTDPKDGATAKLRAAGDKRREEHLKGRNIAKKNEAFSQAAADRNKIANQRSGKVGHGLGWKDFAEDPKEIVDGIVRHFDNITRMAQYDMASDRVRLSMIERFFKKYGYPFELMNDVIVQIERQIDAEYKKARAKEAMLPTSAFAGSDKNKLAPQGQLKGTAPKEQPTHKLVGETDKKKGADGKACWKGYKYAGTKNGKDKCVPIGEAYEAEMASAILKLVEGKI
jgi:hypothetical protein